MSCNEWNAYNLSEVYDFSSGLSKSRKEFGFGYPFVTFKDVFYNYFIPDELTELANTSEKEREKCSVKRGDVFLTRTSETLDELGKSSVALKDYPDTTFNGFTKRLRPNGKIDVYPEYAGYYFRSSKFRAEVNSMATMTTRASLNNDMMARLKIALPSIERQKSIANILLSLDNKIALNNEINKTLEEMAQALFKRWFIDFEFPNEEGKPYKSSGGEMVESELGMIPKGWKSGILNDISEFKYGKMPKKCNITEGGYPIFSGYKISGYYNEFMFEEPQLIVVARGVGGTGDVKFTPSKCYLTNLSIAVLCEEKFNEYLYHYLKRVNLRNLDTGSAQSQITINDLKRLKVIIPNIEVVQKFHYINNTMINKQRELEQESIKLGELRDSLLPKLMSGEIRVDNVETDM